MQFRDWIFPRKCVCCGAYLSDNDVSDSERGDESNDQSEYADVCAYCAKTIVRVKPPYCPQCFRGIDSCRCYNQRPFAFDALVAPFYYEGAIRDAIMRMKFDGKESVARFLGRELGAEVETRCFGVPFDIVTCVPTSSESLASRGFNQSRSIAENLRLSSETFPFIVPDYNLLAKRRSNAVQHRLGAGGRLRNIAGSFELSVNRDVVGKTILLIDDIATTGATADECTRVLKFAGADKVLLATAALTRYN